MDNLDKEIKDILEEEMAVQNEETLVDLEEELLSSEEAFCEECEAAEDAGETEDKAPEEKKKKFLKKDKKKDKKDQQIEELNDRLIRSIAEFDNFRKRTDKEKSQMFDTGAGLIIEKMLPIIDDFERGLMAVGPEEKESSFVTGMEMVYKKMMSTFEELGVSVIDAVGCEFDPMYHNAVMQSPSEEYESGIITQELQKGYMYKDKVIRHSMVMVAE